MNTTDKLIEYLKNHSVDGENRNGELWVKQEYSINGVHGFEWVKLEPNFMVVRDFLGY